MVANCRQILAIELLTAVQACDLAEGLVLSPETQTVHDQFRERVPFLEQDRFQAPDLEAARSSSPSTPPSGRLAAVDRDRPTGQVVGGPSAGSSSQTDRVSTVVSPLATTMYLR